MSNPFEDLQASIEAMKANSPVGTWTPYLVAPNKKLAKQWRKDYPGVDVYVSLKIPTDDKYNLSNMVKSPQGNNEGGKNE